MHQIFFTNNVRIGRLEVFCPEPGCDGGYEASPAAKHELLTAVTRRLAEMVEHQTATAHVSQLAAIVESSDDAIIATSMDGVVLSWNAGAERLYGYSAFSAVPAKPVKPGQLHEAL